MDLGERLQRALSDERLLTKELLNTVLNGIGRDPSISRVVGDALEQHDRTTLAHRMARALVRACVLNAPSSDELADLAVRGLRASLPEDFEAPLSAWSLPYAVQYRLLKRDREFRERFSAAMEREGLPDVLAESYRAMTLDAERFLQPVFRSDGQKVRAFSRTTYYRIYHAKPVPALAGRRVRLSRHMELDRGPAS